MNILDILVIITLSFLMYKYYFEIYKKRDINFNEKKKEKKKEKKIKKKNNQKYYDNIMTEDFSVDFSGEFEKEVKKEKKENIFDTSMKYIDLILQSREKKKVNPYFVEVQFHNDYRDAQNAIILLIPNQRQLFNRSNLPIINVSTPSNDEILPLIKNFIKEINRVLKNNVGDEYIVRDWKNNMAEKEYKSGWDKQQEKLGLPGSIYNTPVGKEPLKLIKVDHKERFETENEIRYVLFLVLQKPSAKDQMLLKISFQIDKQDINIDREFFDKGKNENQTLIKIEEAFVMGFLTKHSFGKHSIKNKYYNFDGITDGRIWSQKEIMNQINQKRKQYELECVYH
jgi:hypothetical protein